MDVQPILLSIFAKNGYYCLLDKLLLKIKTFLDNLFGIKTNNNRLKKTLHNYMYLIEQNTLFCSFFVYC